jgi:hypothetical protein
VLKGPTLPLFRQRACGKEVNPVLSLPRNGRSSFYKETTVYRR